MSLQDKLTQIKNRADAATEGPYTMAINVDDDYLFEASLRHPKKNKNSGELSKVAQFVYDGDQFNPNYRADMEFIAHARTDIPKLLAVIEKLIEQREVYAERAGDQENYESDNAELEKLLGDET